MLKDLLSDDDKLEERVFEVLIPSEFGKGDLLKPNRVIAEDNLAKEPTLLEVRSRVNEMGQQRQRVMYLSSKQIVRNKILI